ncbi:MAG: hypothetical protein HYZ00_12455, partial [Candidatus Hydrogenedentes bacterium]|nr:hypothetical protein [Candidatus Hydrogenedentota bacterium]
LAEARPRSKAAFVLSTALETLAPPAGIEVPDQAEGYAIWTEGAGWRAQVFLTAKEGRGVLFAIGRLLRELHYSSGELALRNTFQVATSPAYRFRGHQLGYRHGANSYDLWSVKQYEQYLRDLIIFGANSVELVSDIVNDFTDNAAEYAGARDKKDGPLLALPQWQMNLKLSALLDAYGLDVWLWEPLAGDVTKPEFAAAEMQWRREFYAEMPRINHIMIPGGDPGNTHPDVLMPWMEKQAAVLHAAHPRAGLWVSNQKFTPEENASLFNYIGKNQPTWLAGLAYGPGTEMSPKELRERTPRQYPIRHYPDITHNVRCQYPAPGLDRIYAQTLDREGINPRPTQEAQTCRVTSPFTNGFVSYSDGCHDDLSKAIWTALSWDPNVNVEEVVQDYARVFFGEAVADDVAQGLLALEQAMMKPMAENAEADSVLALWKQIGKKGGPDVRRSWRYQMYLFRATFDAYIHARLLADLEYEAQAYTELRRAPQIGAAPAIKAAQVALAQADMVRVRPELRFNLEQMGLTLLKSCGLQLSMDEPYRARNPERGALLDKLDRPLNDRPWLELQFQNILKEQDAGEQLRRLLEIVNWEDPGPGGFYDDLGNTRKQPHLVHQTLWENDPGFVYGPQEAHYRQMDNADKSILPVRLSWVDQAETGPTTPVLLRYEGLDPNARFRVRATYFGRYGSVMRLVADAQYEIHGELPAQKEPWPVEFDVPQAATADGTLELAWHLIRNRGVQVSEVWLIRVQ